MVFILVLGNVMEDMIHSTNFLVTDAVACPSVSFFLSVCLSVCLCLSVTPLLCTGHRRRGVKFSFES